MKATPTITTFFRRIQLSYFEGKVKSRIYGSILYSSAYKQ